MDRADDRGTMAKTAAAIYGGAFGLGLIEGLIPGGSQLSNWPGFVALGIAVTVFFVGHRVPRNALAVLGPLGCVLLAWAMVITDARGEGFMLYTWATLWMAYFFGRWGAVVVVVSAAVAHASVLLVLGASSAEGIVDIVAAVTVVAGVTCFLAERNRELVGRLTAEARIDPLTGLLNRRGLQERLEVEQARALREGSSLAVVTLDLDLFKAVNDEHGHEVGDRALTWVAGLLAREVRGTDAAARSGGEEFVVLLPGAGEREGVELAERVRTKVERCGRGPQRTGEGLPQDLTLTVSAGVAASATADGEAALLEADRALYAAKRGGRNRVLSASAVTGEPGRAPEFA